MTVNLKIVQTPAAALYSGLSVAGTSVRVTPYPVDLDGVKLTMSDFGSLGYCTIDPKVSSYEEIISFTGITDNGDGTATLTGLTRDLQSKYPYTGSGTGKLHGSSAVIVYSDNPQIFGRLAGKDNDEVITGVWTVPVPTTALQIANKQYVDQTATGSATYDQNIVVGVAGENLTQGNVVYLKSSDGKWYIADSATALKSVGVKLGIAQATVLSGAATTVLIGGLDKTQTGLSVGSTYYLSTAGAISTTKGANIRLVGRCNTVTTQLLFDTENNPEVSLVDGSRTYVVDTGSANAYVITLVPAITAYKAGQVFSFKAVNANTTASTLNVNGLGVIAIKKQGTTALSANDILAGQIVVVEYDGTNFQMVSTPSTTVTYDAQSKIPVANTYFNSQIFTSSGSWTKPAGLGGTERLRVEVWGAGGAGGGVQSGGTTSASGAGGGAACFIWEARVSDVSSPVTVTVAGSTAGTTGNGSVGGNSTFGTYVTGYGGGGGASAAASGTQNYGGGGGGGLFAAGANATTTSLAAGGAPLGGSAGTSSTFGGGSGGGGHSVYGGGGGNAGNTGGTTGLSVYGGGGGGASATKTGGTSMYGGAGGLGVDDGNGGNGVAPGGGGGGCANTTGTPATYTGGAGARGEIRVYVII